MGFNINVEGDSKNNKIYTKAEWTSVEDKMPEKFKPVLVQLEGNTPFCCVARFNNRWELLYDGCMISQPISHWMPLPEPPENMEGNDEGYVRNEYIDVSNCVYGNYGNCNYGYCAIFNRLIYL